MRRALNLFGIIALTALITYLWVSKDLADQRSARLSLALANAEARATSLEADVESAEQQLARLKRRQEAEFLSSSTSHQTRAFISSFRTSYSKDSVKLLSASNRVGTAGPTASNAAGDSLGPWSTYALATAAGFTNVVRIEGTSSIHNWQVESHLISGSAQFGPGLPVSSLSDVRPGTLDAQVSVVIPVRSLKSVDAAGNPYSDRMDEIIYDKLRAGSYSRITYTLTSLMLKEQPDDASTNFIYEATGQLSIAGRTNTITMPVSLTLAPGGIIQFAGSIAVKMSDFRISPPAPSFDGIQIKTGDEVRLSFVWWVKPVGTVASAK